MIALPASLVVVSAVVGWVLLGFAVLSVGLWLGMRLGFHPEELVPMLVHEEPGSVLWRLADVVGAPWVLCVCAAWPFFLWRFGVRLRSGGWAE